MTTVVIIDFETTGMRAGEDRTIEVAAALVENGQVIATFAELMNPGLRIPPFITSLTGITNAMVRHCPPPEAIMPKLRTFCADHPCVAHNAAFDQRFFSSEMVRAGEGHERPFLCSVLLARRLIVDASTHRLGDLARHLGLTMPPGMRAHRALADVLVTSSLWKYLVNEITRRRAGQPPELDFIRELMRKPKAKVDEFFAFHTRTPQYSAIAP